MVWHSVKFLCGHYQPVEADEAPDVGDELICRHCHKSTPIVWSTSDYRIVCLGCPYRQRFGTAPITAQHAADRHQRKYPTHGLQILQGRKIWEVRSAKRLLQELPFGVDEPPF